MKMKPRSTRPPSTEYDLTPVTDFGPGDMVQPGLAESMRYYNAQPGSSFDLSHLLLVLRRRAPIIMSTILLVTSAVAFLSYNLTPVYTATAVVLTESPKANVINVEEVLQDNLQDAAVIETQINLIRSRSFARRVILELGLQDDPEFNVNDSDPGLVTGVLSSLPSLFGKTNASEDVAQAANLEEIPPPPPSPLTRENDPALDRIIDEWQAGLDIAQSGASAIISIDYTSTSREKAALIANKIAEIYVDDRLNTKQEATTNAADWLSKRINALREKLVESEEAIENFRRDRKLFTDQRVANEKLISINQELDAIQAERARKNAKLGQLERQFRSGEGLESLQEVMQSPIIASLRQQELQLLSQRAQLAKEFGPNHPRRLQLETERENVLINIRAEIGHMIQNFENEIALLDKRTEELQETLPKFRELSSQGHRDEVELAILQRDADANRELYTSFLNRFKELGEQQGLLTSDGRVISNAAIPMDQSFPRPKLMIMAAFVGSSMLGTMLAFLVEMLDRSLKSPQQIENLFGVPAYGPVPKIPSLRQGMKAHEYLLERPRSAYTEAINTLGLSLRTHNTGKVILVTSALPNEGKTTLAYSLATVLTRTNKTVILVDLDLRNPSVIDHMGLPVNKRILGLNDLLDEKATCEQVIQPDANTANLDIIANERPASNSVELISSQAMESLIDELRRDYDYVVLDTPPLLGIVDTKLIAGLADAALVAVRWNKTKEDAAQMAIDILHDCNLDAISAVLTQGNLRKMGKLQYGDASKYYKQIRKYYDE